MLAAHGWHAYEAVTIVSWCGHGIERILVPERDGWFGEIRATNSTRISSSVGSADVRCNCIGYDSAMTSRSRGDVARPPSA